MLRPRSLSGGRSAYNGFGRGRGKGTAARSNCMNWLVVTARNAAIESLDGDLRTAGDPGMEPVSNSLGGSCFAPLLTFRSASTPNTRTTATTKLSRLWRPDLSQGTATRFRILTAPKRENFVPSREVGTLRCFRLIDY